MAGGNLSVYINGNLKELNMAKWDGINWIHATKSET